jgi:restriction system protein
VIGGMAERNGRNSSKSQKKGPEFVRFFGPVIMVLKELGDSGRPKEVSERVAQRLRVCENDLNRTNKNGQSRFENQVAWARFYLAKAGYIETSQRGVWALTDVGRRSTLDDRQAFEIFKTVQETFKNNISDTAPSPVEDESSPPDIRHLRDNEFRVKMAEMLRALSAEGFEKLCQKLLREVGFEEVIVTGRTGDGGIDGYGTLKINRLVSDRVIFQCKKHAKQISPAYIREFRGSMVARADRGIFLATSTFSVEAKREAAREGAAPIEMVDLDALISLLIELGLGVMEKTIYEVDEGFFRDYLPVCKAQTPDGTATAL